MVSDRVLDMKELWLTWSIPKYGSIKVKRPLGSPRATPVACLFTTHLGNHLSKTVSNFDQTPNDVSVRFATMTF